MSPAALADGFPNDPLFERQRGLVRIGVPEAWSRSTGQGVLMALFDLGGPDPEHEDLTGRIVPWVDGSVVSPDHHATAMASIAVASANNGRGMAGAAHDALLMAAPLVDYDEKKIVEAVDHGARVLFFEYGEISPISYAHFLFRGNEFPVGGHSRRDAVEYAYEHGAIVLGPAGNESFPACTYPAAHRGVVCVGGVDSGLFAGDWDQRSESSNFGFRVDVMAPSISTIAYWDRNAPGVHDQYETAHGTSVSVAFAAGVAALLIGAGATGEEAARLLKCTADDLGDPGPDFVYGHGRINAARAVASIGSGITCADPPGDIYEMLGQG